MYQATKTSSILAPSHGIMSLHEPLWVTYENQPKIQDNGEGIDGVCYVWIGIWTHYQIR
jgi:hypothetical protein